MSEGQLSNLRAQIWLEPTCQPSGGRSAEKG